jgi:hypothetical protein
LYCHILFLVKKDHARRTGTRSGKEVKMTEVDHEVIEILSKDSINVNGIGVNDTLKTAEEVFQPDTEISAVEELMQNCRSQIADP